VVLSVDLFIFIDGKTGESLVGYWWLTWRFFIKRLIFWYFDWYGLSQSLNWLTWELVFVSEDFDWCSDEIDIVGSVVVGIPYFTPDYTI